MEINMENLLIITLTQDLMSKYMTEVIREVEGFEYLNWTEENYLKDLPEKWKYSLAVLTNENICAFSINSRKSGIYYIHFFYVFEKFRNKGIGKKLLKACENLSNSESIRKLQLKCPKDNLRARKFYLENGYYMAGNDEKKDNYYLLEKKIS